MNRNALVFTLAVTAIALAGPAGATSEMGGADGSKGTDPAKKGGPPGDDADTWTVNESSPTGGGAGRTSGSEKGEGSVPPTPPISKPQDVPDAGVSSDEGRPRADAY